MSAELFHGLDKTTAGLAKLNHAGLQIVQWTLHETVLLLVVRQEVVPKRMLKQLFSVFLVCLG